MSTVMVKGVAIEVVSRRRTSAGEYVGRPSPLGNPYRMGPRTRAEAVDAYRKWLADRVAAGDPAVCKELERLRKKALAEKRLVLSCWCAPLPCHAEVIADTLARVIAAGSGFSRSEAT